jgi:hypothetical protein
MTDQFGGYPENEFIDGNLFVRDLPVGAGGAVTCKQINASVLGGLAPSGDATGATDTANIQGLLNIARTAQLGLGSFVVSATLNPVTGSVLAGTGEATQIQWDQAVVGTLIKAPGVAAVQYVGIRDIRLSQTNAAAAGTAVEASHFQFSRIERVLIDKTVAGAHPNIGVSYNSADCHYNALRDCVINCDGANAIAVRYANGANSNVLKNCRILPSTSDASQTGIFVDAYAIELDHPDIENAAGTAISLGVNATSNRPTQIIAPYLEANGTNIATANTSQPAAFAARWTVIKPALTARASTIAVAQDPDLALTMLPGRVYRFKFLLVYDGPGAAAADLKLSLIAQGGAAIQWTVNGLDTTAGIAAPHGPAIMAAAQAAGTLQSVATAAVGTPCSAVVEGTVGPGAGGTFALQWAQRVSNPTAVTLYASSTLTMEQVA